MEGFKECDKANHCEYGCHIHPGYCAIGEPFCPKDTEEYECHIIEEEMNDYESN